MNASPKLSVLILAGFAIACLPAVLKADEKNAKCPIMTEEAAVRCHG